MKLSVIPYGKQWIDDEDIRSVVQTLKSDWITQGKIVEKFEKLLSSYVNSKYAVAFSNGSAALQAAYFAADIKEGAEVITSPLTFAATANAAIWQGANVVFADIVQTTGNIDPEEVSKKISKKTKAIVAVDYAGLPADFEELKNIARKHKLVLIEDASHSLGAIYKDLKVGGISDLTTFSFHPVKIITTGEGGAVTTNNKDYYQKLLIFRNHGIVKDRGSFLKKNSDPWYYEMQELGLNYRLTDFQAALGISQLSKIDKFLSLRRKQAEFYGREFKHLDNILLPSETFQSQSAWHLYVIRLLGDKSARGKMFRALKKKCIQTQVHYIPVYWHPYFINLGYKLGLCPEAEKWYESCLSLPLFPRLKKNDQLRVINAIKEVLS